MSYLKKYGIRLFYNIMEVLLLILFITILFYFNIIGSKLYSFLKLIILLSSIFINSFILGRNTNSKGYLEGIRYGVILIVIFIISTIFLGSLRPRLLIYYIIIFTTSILGSMVGISNKKRK